MRRKKQIKCERRDGCFVVPAFICESENSFDLYILTLGQIKKKLLW